MKQVSPPAKKYAAAAGLIVWVTLGLQFYVTIANNQTGAATAIWQFFSYFTILTNTIVAVTFTAIALSSPDAPLTLFTRSASLTAVTVYIFMVALVANTLLTGLLALEGLPLVLDKFLHLINPFLMLLFWVLFVSKKGLSYQLAFIWLWYPILYIIYLIILGENTGFYPYPFTNVTKLGYGNALLNGLGITAAFAISGVTLIALSRLWKREK